MYGTSKSIVTTKPVLREAPPVLEHEKFRYENGNVYEVKVRGDKIYFRGIVRNGELDTCINNGKYQF